MESIIIQLLENAVDGGFKKGVDELVKSGKVDAAEGAALVEAFDKFTDAASPVLAKLFAKK